MRRLSTPQERPSACRTQRSDAAPMAVPLADGPARPPASRTCQTGSPHLTCRLRGIPSCGRPYWVHLSGSVQAGNGGSRRGKARGLQAIDGSNMAALVRSTRALPPRGVAVMRRSLAVWNLVVTAHVTAVPHTAAVSLYRPVTTRAACGLVRFSIGLPLRSNGHSAAA